MIRATHRASSVEHAGPGRWRVLRWSGGLAAAAAYGAAWIGLALIFSLFSERLATITAADQVNDSRTNAPTSVQLAQALTAALNAHDVDTLVELFTDEDAGPTITADRFAWLKYEIHLWAERQAGMHIQMSAHGYWLTEEGAAWDAEVYRDDWAAVGIPALHVTNSIWVHEGRIANFTSRADNPREAELLGDLWRPGAKPSWH